MSQQGTFNVSQVQTVLTTRGKRQVCVCNRPKGYVMCQTCGTTVVSRVHKPCAEHPGVTHLMDMEACPKCFSRSLLEKCPEPKAIDRR